MDNFVETPEEPTQEALHEFLGIEGEDVVIGDDPGASVSGQTAEQPEPQPEAPKEPAPTPAAEPAATEEPAEVPAGEELTFEARKELARRGYSERVAADREQRRQAEERKAQLAAEKEWREDFLDAIREGRKAPAESEAEGRKLTDDPDEVFEQEKKANQTALEALNEKYEELLEWKRGRERADEDQAIQARQQAAKLREIQLSAQEYEAQFPGFLGEYDANGQLLRPGVYEAWHQAYTDQLASIYPQHEIQRRFEDKINYFLERAAAEGESPWTFLERHAVKIVPESFWGDGGSGEGEAPAAPAAAPAANGQRKPAAKKPNENVAAARRAQESGLAGTISQGATSTPRETPKTMNELMEAGVSGRRAAQMLFEEHGDDIESVIDIMLTNDGFNLNGL